jgi:streptogramin lyase
VLVVLAQDDLGFAFAVDLEDANAVSVGFGGESYKVFGGLQPKAGNDCVSDVGEPSDPRRLLRNQESPQDIWIARGAKGKLNRKCVCEIR